MIPVLYPPNTTDFSSFGLGVLTDTISCEVTEERNGVFECLLKYPVSGQHYGLITKECIIKAKPNDTAADQAFRIYRITKPLNGIVTIYGQHISYDLANVPVMPFSTESRSPQLILSQLLAGDTRFTGRTDYSDAKAFSVAQPKSVRACLGGTEGSMLSKWHGEFEWDNFTVKFHSHRGQKTGVVIEYGKVIDARFQPPPDAKENLFGNKVTLPKRDYELLCLLASRKGIESQEKIALEVLLAEREELDSYKAVTEAQNQAKQAETENEVLKSQVNALRRELRRILTAYPEIEKEREKEKEKSLSGMEREIC